MRLLSFQQNNKSAVGVRIGDDVVNISEAAPHLPSSIIDILRGGPEALAAVEKAANSAGKAFRVAAAEITHLLPITHPDKNIGLGKNYVKHVIEMGGEPPSFPGMFFRIPDSMTAHNQPIWRPEISDTLDYEGELMVVIGKAGRMIPIEKALEYVAGYSCHNDGSLREYNRIPAAVSSGKNFLHTGGFGPEIVTADELPPGCEGLRLTTKVNGELRQDVNLSDMHWNVAHLIHLMSRLFTLYPGDLIGTGTPAGCAAGFKPPKWLVPGDIVDVSIEGIGTLTNSIIDAPKVDENYL